MKKGSIEEHLLFVMMVASVIIMGFISVHHMLQTSTIEREIK